MFPNPFTNELIIAFSSFDAMEVQMSVYNISGQLQFSEKREIEEGLSRVYLDKADIQKWVSGVYILHITGDNGFLAIRKLIKH